MRREGAGPTAVVGAGLQRRSRLIRELDAVLDGGVALVVGGPGSGKTCLVSSWADQRATGIDVVSARPASPDGVPDLTAACEELAERAAWSGRRRGVVVVDDTHRDWPSPTVDAVAEHLASGPSDLAFVICTRDGRSHPWDRVRAGRQLVVIGPRDLAFDDAEASEFLRAWMGLDVAAGISAQVNALVEGWAAGLRMAGEEIRRHGGDPTALVGWAGRSRALSQYFASEVRVAMTGDELALVEQTAHLPSLEPDLCDLVTGRQDCAELLDRLCVRNLFTEPVAGVPDAYRYHPLFAGEMARHRGQADRGSLTDTLGSAADWYAARGDTDRAIEASLRAGDGQRTAGLLRSVAGPMLRRGQAALLVSWLERMPQDDLWKDPALALALARACGLAGDSLTPRAVLRALGPQVASAGEQSPGLRVAAALLESSTRGWEGRLASMGDPLWDIPERLGELAGDPMLAICALDETALGNSRVRAHLMGGDLAAAIRETDTALTPAEIQTPSRYTVVSVGLRALALAWSGDEPQAREAVAQGMRVLRRFAGTGTDALWLHLASAWVADEPQASASLDQVQEYAARTGLPYIRALAALAACAWHLRLGSLADAATAHTAARREVEHLPEPGFLATLVERFRTDPRLIPEPSAELNRQETLMLRLLAQGATRSQIAAQTSYSVNTVKTYLRSAYRKLGITDREQAVAAAVALGLVEPGSTDQHPH